jgi:hypothetical protein
LQLAHILVLPTTWMEGKAAYVPLTMIVCDGRIARVFYPVEDLPGDAANVMDWIRGRAFQDRGS